MECTRFPPLILEIWVDIDEIVRVSLDGSSNSPLSKGSLLKVRSRTIPFFFPQQEEHAKAKSAKDPPGGSRGFLRVARAQSETFPLVLTS